MLKNLLLSMRPKQWSKNIVVFAGLFFAGDIFNREKIVSAVLAFALFCLISSAGYLINDVSDRRKDALHPQKKHRPVAAGKISPAAVLVLAMIMIFAGVASSFAIGRAFGLIIAFYILTSLLYSFFLKRVVIVDVMIIASGFMFRAIGGTLAIDEEVSSWLIICTIFLALFLALSKRRAELLALGEGAAAVRETLAFYSPVFLDQMITTMTSASLMSYALYTLDPATVSKFGTRDLVFTMPFVIYGLFRYLHLVHNKQLGEAPDTAILRDAPLLICIALYGLSVVLILYS